MELLSKGFTDASTTLKTDSDCTACRKECVTNGCGCLDSAIKNWADYTGDRASCLNFKGLNGLCRNSSGAL